MTSPETRYAKSGDLHIAYQVIGDGPIDLVFIPSWFSHVEMLWEGPQEEKVLSRLASFSRLILFDPRGTGMSDPVPISEPPMLEERMDDILAVMEACGSTCAAVFGAAYGGQLAAMSAATHPERVSALVLYNASARYLADVDYHIGAPAEIADLLVEYAREHWGMPGTADWIPGATDRLKEWLPRFQRLALSPGAAAALYRTHLLGDVRQALPSIQVPTLIVHRKRNPVIPASHGRYLAEHIPSARYVEVAGVDQLWFVEDTTPVLDHVEEFLTGEIGRVETDRVLATVMFTDIVRSTEIAAEIGDERWSDTLEAHKAILQRQLDRFNGRLVETTGDGILATFDGPARAIRSAVAMKDAVRSLGLEIRVGLHTGEIELAGRNIAGIGVNIAARVMAQAGASEVLVSSTVRDLVVGSGIAFEERGTRSLKGVPGEWSLFAVTG